MVLTTLPCQRVDLGATHLVVAIQELPPLAVPHLRGPRGRVDDVREEDGREHPVGVLRGLQRPDLLRRPGVVARLARTRWSASRSPGGRRAARRPTGTTFVFTSRSGRRSMPSRKRCLPLPRINGKRSSWYSSIRPCSISPLTRSALPSTRMSPAGLALQLGDLGSPVAATGPSELAQSASLRVFETDVLRAPRSSASADPGPRLRSARMRPRSGTWSGPAGTHRPWRAGRGRSPASRGSGGAAPSRSCRPDAPRSRAPR